MAVVLADDEFYPTVRDRVASCLLCGKPFEDEEPAVFWEGSEQSLYLHGGCAGSFVLRLARDAWDVERRADDGEFTLTPHSARTR